MSRDTSQPAPGWRAVTVGVWVREPHGGPAALVRAHAGAFLMRVDGGAWQHAGDTLLAAQEHAGGHACGYDDPRVLDVKTCGECSRLAKMEG